MSGRSQGLPALLAGLMLACAATSVQADTVDARCDIYPKGSDRAAAVVPCTFSQRQGFISIQRADGVRHDLRPQRGRGNFVDAQGKRAIRAAGLGKHGQIFRLSRESVYVYWDTAGLAVGALGAPAVKPVSKPASKPAAAPAALLALPTVTPATAIGAFDRTLELHGIRFRVKSENDGSINRLEITPSGLERDNATVVRDVDGRIVGAEVADLDADGSPEVYVYVRSVGSGSYGSLYAFSANRRRSLSEIFLPPLSDLPSAARGYMGHDEFAVVESSLARRFPVYRDPDSNARPTGGMRQLQYRLAQGEAGWLLRVERVVEY